MEPKKLYRSRRDRMVCGVCAGIAEYFNIDPTLIRLGLVLLACREAGYWHILLRRSLFRMSRGRSELCQPVYLTKGRPFLLLRLSEAENRGGAALLYLFLDVYFP